MTSISSTEQFEIILRKVQFITCQYDQNNIQIILFNKSGQELQRSYSQKIKSKLANFYGQTIFFPQNIKQIVLAVMISGEILERIYINLEVQVMGENGLISLLSEGKYTRIFWQIIAEGNGCFQNFASHSTKLEVFYASKLVARSQMLEKVENKDSQENLQNYNALQRRQTLSQKLSNSTLKKWVNIPTAQSLKGSSLQKQQIKIKKKEQKVSTNKLQKKLSLSPLRRYKKNNKKMSKIHRTPLKLYENASKGNIIKICLIGLLAGVLSAHFYQI